MHFSRLALAALGVTAASAAPSFDSSALSPAAPLFSWFSDSLSQWVASAKTSEIVDDASAFAASLGGVNPFDKPEYKDMSIWEVIQTNSHLTDLKKVLKYAGPKSKELLDDKSKKLTFLGG